MSVIGEKYFVSTSYTHIVDEFRVKYPNIVVPNNWTMDKLPISVNLDQFLTERVL